MCVYELTFCAFTFMQVVTIPSSSFRLCIYITQRQTEERTDGQMKRQTEKVSQLVLYAPSTTKYYIRAGGDFH